MELTVQSRPLVQVEDDNRLVYLWLSTKTERTRRAYEEDIAIFGRFVDYKSIQAITLVDLIAYQQSLAEKVKPATVRRRLASIKSLFSFAKAVGYLQVNPAAALKVSVARPSLSGRIMSKDDVVKVIQHAEPRFRTLLKLLFVAGLRISEALALRGVDLKDRNDQGQISVLGKGGKWREILLPGGLYAELKGLGAAQDERLFPFSASTVWRAVNRAGQEAGLGRSISAHWFRHAHVTEAMNSGVRLHVIKETVGHSSVAVTSQYLHARPDESSALALEVACS